MVSHSHPLYLKDQLKKCLVVGGFGFLGHALVEKLLVYSCDVRLFSPEIESGMNENIDYFNGSILSLEDLKNACRGIDTVFHVASLIYPYKFVRRHRRDNVYNVNVIGTQNVIEACVQCGVARLIYTSSNNVVFDHEILNGDESLPYVSNALDIYTETKVLAEKAVINANGKAGLLTCALRPGGIYGPGDKQMLFRLIQALKKGQFIFTIGDGRALADSVFVDNLVHAHLLAAEKLKKDSSVAGQAYFISDGDPANYFGFTKSLVQRMGYKYPKFSVPYSIVYMYAYIAEIIHWLFDRPKPFLTIMEVKKVGISNYFSIDKAKRELGYIPHIAAQEGIEKSYSYCTQILSRIQVVDRPHILWWLSVLGGMILLGVLAFQSDASRYWDKHFPLINSLYLKVLFVLAVLTHFIEAVYAFRLAKRIGFKDIAFGWFFQTLLLGFPSLRLLMKKTKPIHQL